MDELNNMLLAFESSQYKEYLEKFAECAKYDIVYDHTENAVIVKFNSKQYKIKLPNYCTLDKQLLILKSMRNDVFLRHRYLRDKIVYSEKVEDDVKQEYDLVTRKLMNIDTDLEVLDLFAQSLANESQRKVQDLLVQKEYLKEATELEKGRKTSLQLLKDGLRIENDLSNEHKNCIDYYIKALPQVEEGNIKVDPVSVKKAAKPSAKKTPKATKATTADPKADKKEEEQKPKRGRKPKPKPEDLTKVNVNGKNVGEVDKEKLKVIVKAKVAATRKKE
jgi:hypothetical protein